MKQSIEQQNILQPDRHSVQDRVDSKEHVPFQRRWPATLRQAQGRAERVEARLRAEGLRYQISPPRRPCVKVVTSKPVKSVPLSTHGDGAIPDEARAGLSVLEQR